MILTYHRWPFLPSSMRTPEQENRWWLDCFVATPAIENFINARGAAAVVGGPGSGKSTAVAALKRAADNQALLIPYPTLNWPQGKRPWLPGQNHISQIMAAAATEITRHLNEHPEQFANINDNPLHEEFLCWLVEKHLRRRALTRLKYRLEQATGLALSIPNQIEDIYPSNVEEADVWGQISELVDLAQALNHDKIILLIDLDEANANRHLDDLITLFSWLDLMEHPNFLIRAALPRSSVEQGQIATRSSGRLAMFRLTYPEATIQQIIGRHLQVATEGQYDDLGVLAETAVLRRAQKEIRTLYQTPTLAGWLDWTETLMVSSAQSDQGLLSDPDEAAYHYYLRHIPLRLDPDKQGVWRGPQFLPLDAQPFELLTKLFDLRGQPAPDALLDVAGSGPNLNTLISRLRKIIEPVSGKKVYFYNRRDQGYWLENFTL